MTALKSFFNSLLLSYASTLFSSKRVVGFFILLVTFINPYTGFTGLLGCTLSNQLASIIGVHEERIQKGLYGFNGLLVGLSFSLYHDIDPELIIMLFAAIVLLLFITLSLEHILGYFLGLPVLSLPFVLVSIVVYFSFYNYSGFTMKEVHKLPFSIPFPQLPPYVEFYFKSLGGIFFQSNLWAGFFISLIIFFSSRIAFILSLIGYLTGISFHLLLKGSSVDLSGGVVGFNYILTAIAVGGYFLVPGPGSFLMAFFAAISSSVIASFAKIFLVQFNIPVLALPFTTTSLMFVYVARLLRNKNYIVVDFPPGSPEDNLDYYKTRRERFGVHGLYIRLPFSGRWMISQGYSGEYTHKGQWKESLDFMAVNGENKTHKGDSENINDYFTFGLPVLAPCNGRIIKIVNHIEDNPLYQVETKDNWGNLVLIEHTAFLYSQVSHLQKNSIIVKEGDYVTAGTKLGLAGNSGRSPLPHIHLHFQATPEIGSSTIPINLTQYFDETSENALVKFNSIPEEKSIVSNLNSDFNLKTFFTIAPGQTYPIEFQKNQKVYTEIWKAKLDFWGNRFIEDEKGNRIYFFIAQDYFSAVEFLGKSDSALFYFYLSVYRIPFVSSASTWKDKISYKYFSEPFLRHLKDLVQPFSDRVSFEWSGRIKQTESGTLIESSVGREDQKPLIRQELKLNGSIPGEIQIYRSEKEIFTIRKKSE